MYPVLRLIRLPGVLDRSGNRRSTHYNLIRDGLMVPPINIGERARAYPQHEIEAIIEARIAGQSDQQIRELVTRLVAQRALTGTEGTPEGRETGQSGRIREVEPLRSGVDRSRERA
jgi:prophage regulatory protein